MAFGYGRQAARWDEKLQLQKPRQEAAKRMTNDDARIAPMEEDLATARFALVRRAASFPVANNVSTVAVWDTVVSDPGGYFNGSDAFVVHDAGVYLLHFAGAWTSFGSGGRTYTLQKNGADFQVYQNTNQAAEPTGRLSFVVPLLAGVGDYFSIRLLQNSGVALNFADPSIAPAWTSYFGLQRIH